jgi:hypothetical protein
MVWFMVSPLPQVKPPYANIDKQLNNLQKISPIFCNLLI